MYFSKFNAAENDLLNTYNINKNSLDPVHRSSAEMSKIFAWCIKNGHRFFLPSASDIVSDKVVDQEAKFYLMNLPYDCVVVLSDTYISEEHYKKSESSISTWKISIAIDIYGETNNKIRFFPLDKAQRGDYIVASILFAPMYDKWLLSYAYVVSYYPLDAIGYRIRQFSGNPFFDYLQEKIGIDHLRKEMDCDLNSIQNLCLMLGLNNVKTRLEIPDKKLIKRREKNGKQPLYSYSVLRVDNTTWDRIESNRGSRCFLGRRTHFRRGHIRRLNNGNRVWVKAALVSGSVRGFCDKEYHVGSV